MPTVSLVVDTNPDCKPILAKKDHPMTIKCEFSFEKVSKNNHQSISESINDI